MKLAVCLSAYFGSKTKLADGFMVWRGIKLWNRQSRSGKKMKLTARGRGEFFKNCTRALRALVQFSKNSPLPRPSVSFFSRPTLDGFIILAPSKHETAASFIFEPKKQTTKPPVSFSFTWNWPQKKKKKEVSLLKPHIYSNSPVTIQSSLTI